LKNKVVMTVLGTLLSVSAIFGAAYASGTIKIVVNGDQVPTDVEPRMINNRVMVPISFISKALGADVSWDQKKQTVTVNSFGMKYTEVWKEDISSSMSRFDVAAINNTVQVFMAGMDQGDADLLKKSVTSDLDVDYLKQLHFSMGPTMFSTQINDIRTVKVQEGQLREYQVQVSVQTWLGTPTVDYWDLTVVETDTTKYKNVMQYLIKAYKVSSTEVEEYRVFPGYTFKF
jgi:hypothetical protein